MSLLASASPWQNDNPVPKKRVATMGDSLRKTVKLRPQVGGEDYATQENPAILGNSIQETQAKNEESNTKINTLLNKITGFSESGGGKLADFNPPPPPESVYRKAQDARRLAEGPIDMPPNPLMPSSIAKPTPTPNPSGYYKPMETRTYSNYAQVYPDKMTEIRPTAAPYYAKMGIGAQGSGDKVAEKLNYMVHLLEEMQMEKTNHVTEEFVLYTMLGVFMIYLVDGFAQTGKYVR
jgi:uncharacterized coiled-coil protein SlyX